MENLPVEVSIDDRAVNEWITSTDGRQLNIRTAPIASSDISLTLFIMPFNYYFNLDSLEKEIHCLEGKEVDMGKLPHLRRYNQSSLSIDLREGNGYDVFVMGKRKEDVGRTPIIYGRFVKQEIKVPSPLTFEEMRYVAIEGLGLTPAQAKGVNAVVDPSTELAVGNDVFCPTARFKYGKNEAGHDIGNMVQHNGVVKCYDNASVEQVRAIIGR